MRDILSALVLGASLLAGGHSASAQQIVIEGVQIEPTAGECIRAIERGVQIEAPEDRPRRVNAYFVYDGRMYLIMLAFGHMTCVAWEM